MTDTIPVSREKLRQVLDALCAAMEFDAGDAESEVFDAAAALRAALEQPGQEQFTRGELDLLRQWYNSMQDTNSGYVIDDDRALYKKILAAIAAAPQPVQPINQCDGCRSGQEMRGPLHIDRDGKPTMVCQAGMYKNGVIE